MLDNDGSNINLVGAIFIFVTGVLTLILPRRLSFFPLIASACFMTLGQVIVVGGLHFSAMRIIVGIGLLRVIVRREFDEFELNVIDKLIIIYALIGIITNFLLWGTYDAFKGQLGATYNVVGIYFLFRFTIRSLEDIQRSIKIIVLFSIPLAGFMALEYLSGYNIFSIFGAVGTGSRDGIIRCQGPFRHPILAGTFGATSMPLLLGLWPNWEKGKIWLMLGIAANAMITFTAGSSGPTIAYGFALIGLIAWKFRRYIPFIVWGIPAAIISLHIVMKAPVWFLIARINVFSASTGWHRAYLIDQAVEHFNEWWLIGTKYTADWMPYALAINPEMADITNQFIAEGVTGGLMKLFLFIGIILMAFKKIKKQRQTLEEMNRALAFQVWSIGVSLLAHVVSFFSISYFDQMTVFYYMVLAYIAVLNEKILESSI